MSSSDSAASPDQSLNTIVVATEEVTGTMNSSGVTGGETTTDLNTNTSDGSPHGVASPDVPPPSPAKSTGDSSNNSSGDSGGGISTDLNVPLSPSNLDSVTSDAPLSHAPPPPATNLSNDENVASSSYSEKPKRKHEIRLFGITITKEVDEDEASPGRT
ncbi:unnamed protein product [Microthlaspi erraticum]|uniref:Uncharacterized protein n=1 Tax=Microthlaspi erraticum TaxID=1685480 RepID=A0A6D2JY95_9BRAS|nr:unnamed protein product [Microthlaspi erraticum]